MGKLESNQCHEEIGAGRRVERARESNYKKSVVVVVSQARGNRFGLGSPPRPNGSFNREKGGSREGEQGPNEWL